MSDSLFSKIKKFIAKNETSSDNNELIKENITNNIQIDKDLETEETSFDEITKSDETNETEHLLSDEDIGTEKARNILSTDINEDLSNNLKSFLEQDNNAIYGCIVDKKQLAIKGFYSKNNLTDEYIKLLVENLVDITLNKNKIIFNENNDIDKLLIISEDNCQYLIADRNYMTILITGQKNQIIIWKLMEKIRERITAL